MVFHFKLFTMKNNLIIIGTVCLLIAACNTKPKNNNMETTAMKHDTVDFKSGYSDVNGIKMYYEIHGAGEPLVLIHGGGSTIGTSFGRILPLLAAKYKVIAVELQAHGHTSDRNAPESFAQDADDVAMLLHNLDIEKAYILGFSNGGNTAMQISYRHPAVVNKLILASTFYKRDGLFPGFFDMMKGATINDMPMVLKEAFLKINPDSAKLQNMFNKDRERMLHFENWSDEVLTSIKVPTLIISGDQDVATHEHTIAMAKLIPGARLMVLPAAHGGYMGVAESPAPDGKMLEFMAWSIEEFLGKNERMKNE